MPDSKITALTSISTSTDPANDPLVIVDVSDTSMAATGTTKKVTLNQLLGASGTATLASATITGDLTVDTNVLKVDTTLNRVGIGTATPDSLLQMAGAGTINWKLSNTSDSVTVGAYAGTTTGTTGTVSNHPFFLFTNNTERYRLASDGVATWSNVGGVAGTAMTLNSTGLGLGVSPSYKLDIFGTVRIGTANPIVRLETGTNTGFIDYNDTRLQLHAGPLPMYFVTGSTLRMTLDAIGNLLVGTTDTSSTSGAGFKIIGSGLGPYVVNAASTNAALAYTMYSTGAAAYRFYVGWGGTVFATNTTISAISDARLKENVQDIDVGLGAILALKPRKFDWKAGKGKDIKGDRGFIAQEFEQVFPQLVDEWKDAAPEGEAPYKSVRQDLIPVLVKAIQELAAEVNALKNA